MTYNVEVLVMPAQPIAVARGAYGRGAVADVLLPLMGKAADYVKKHAIPSDGRMVGIYHKDGMEGGMRVLAPFTGEGAVYCAMSPAGRAAHVLSVGAWRGQAIHDGHQAIRDWSKSTGNALAGVNWEVYGHHT